MKALDLEAAILQVLPEVVTVIGIHLDIAIPALEIVTVTAVQHMVTAMTALPVQTKEKYPDRAIVRIRHIEEVPRKVTIKDDGSLEADTNMIQPANKTIWSIIYMNLQDLHKMLDM